MNHPMIEQNKVALFTFVTFVLSCVGIYNNREHIDEWLHHHEGSAPIDHVEPSPLTISCPLTHNFIGSGFHQKFSLTTTLVNTTGPVNVTVTMRLSSAFFIDMAEALQQYEWRNDSNEIDARPRLWSLESKFPFDIEIAVFRVTSYEENIVTFVFQLPSDGTWTLLFPIHTRYEDLDNVTAFSWNDFLSPQTRSFKKRCVVKSQLSGSIAAKDDDDESVQFTIVAVGDDACVWFPQGVLAHLPVVYALTMGLLVIGALIVMVMIR